MRELWRSRWLVAAFAVVAIIVGFLLSYTASFPPESRKYEVGMATARILVDTPDSQVVDVAPRGSETLGARATLIANLMTTGKVKAEIARRAGLRPKELLAGVALPDAPPRILTGERIGPDSYLLTTSPVSNAASEPLPIIEVSAQAPNTRDAARLADAAVAGLGDYLDSKAATEEVPNARRLQVTGLGTPQVAQVVRGPKRVVAVGAALFIFIFGCAAILIGGRLVRGWRAASGWVGPDSARASATNGSGTAEPADARRPPPAPRRKPVSRAARKRAKRRAAALNRRKRLLGIASNGGASNGGASNGVTENGAVEHRTNGDQDAEELAPAGSGRAD